MSAAKPRLVHLTTTDISLELLLGPQLVAFADAGYEVIAMSAPGPFVAQIEARGIRHFPLRNATRSMDLRRDASALVELKNAFKTLSPDIVHTHNPKPGVYGRIAARWAKVPVVVNTVHGLYALPSDRFAKRAVVYSLERLAASFSNAELVQNPEDIDTLRSLTIPKSKLAVLGNGVDLSRFNTEGHTERRTRARDELGLDHSRIVVGAVGRLVEEKGYLELFDAWARVRDSHADAELIVVGPTEPDKADGVTSERIEAAERNGVRFLGMRDDVEEIYHALDLYVLASHREGFPRSAMEAAACGLPIIATNIRGCRQVVDDTQTGLLFEPKNTHQLAEALDSLLGDEGLRGKMGHAAAAKAISDFDQQRVIDLTLETYGRLLSELT